MPTLLSLAIAFLLPHVVGPTPVLMLSEPDVMKELEGAGLSLGARLGSEQARTTAALRRETAWKNVADVLSRDLERHRRGDGKSGVGIRFAHRLFDKSWLRGEDTRFELVAVVNRLDREAFHPEHCGEVRLVYRLGYERQVRGQSVASRLPMTVNLVYWQTRRPGGESCSEVAKRWWVDGASGDDRLPARALTAPGGPLHVGALGRESLKTLEVNLQSVRWPSTLHPTLGGHAEYVMRVFTPRGSALFPSVLENTPDVQRLKSRPALRKELLAWLVKPENFEALDNGTARIPDKFLAQRSISVTPRGLARLGNRPFQQLFKASELAAIDYEKGRYVRSPAALLRRLDSRTCAGCHQSRSVAGFHVLGEDDATRSVDALAYGHSAHVQADLDRREAYLRARVLGVADVGRGLGERLEKVGGHGSRCGLGDPGFEAWTCGEGLRCVALDDAQVGTCVSAGEPEIGDPCEVGTLRTRTVPHKDRVRDSAPTSCGDGRVCESNPVGFPNGMCAGGCDSGGMESTCGAIALLTPFNRCLARKEPFTKCIVENVRPAALRRCSVDAPCRDDYVCARTPGGEGACLPPYFLFQLRVDGH